MRLKHAAASAQHNADTDAGPAPATVPLPAGAAKSHPAQLDVAPGFRYYAFNWPPGGFFYRAAISYHMNRFLNYLRATRGELKHVSWPTQRQTAVYTLLVILISIVTAFYLGALDYIFTKALSFLLP